MVIKKDSQKTIKRNVYKKNETTKNTLKKPKSNLKTVKETINNENKPKYTKIQIKNFSKTIFGIICAIIIFALIVFSCIKIYQYALQSHYFNITEIEYTGNKIITKEELNACTQLQIGKNILLYDINTIEVNLFSNPWIKEVRIKRTLPSKMYIEVIEKEPMFWATKDEKLFYLDKHLNFITEVTKDVFILLPTINIKFATEEAIEFLPHIMDEILKMNLSFDLKDITWVSINHAKGYELYIEKQNLNISIALHNWQENIKNLADVIKDLENRNEINKIQEIRAAHNQVTVIKS